MKSLVPIFLASRSCNTQSVVRPNSAEGLGGSDFEFLVGLRWRVRSRSKEEPLLSLRRMLALSSRTLGAVGSTAGEKCEKNHAVAGIAGGFRCRNRWRCRKKSDEGPPASKAAPIPAASESGRSSICLLETVASTLRCSPFQFAGHLRVDSDALSLTWPGREFDVQCRGAVDLVPTTPVSVAVEKPDATAVTVVELPNGRLGKNDRRRSRWIWSR